MRRKDRELTEAEAREVLRRAEYGVLCGGRGRDLFPRDDGGRREDGLYGT